MTSAERIAAVLSGREPDRVPYFILSSVHGARALGLSIRDYFARPEHVVEGQLRLRARYRHDCLFPFYYAAVEHAAWGGEVMFRDDGAPLSGAPILRRIEDVTGLAPPVVRESAALRPVLETTASLAARAGGEVPILAAVIAPTSLPILQLGFERYLVASIEQPEAVARLVAMNEEFCVEWANAQVDAGAGAIAYFDPVASPTVTSPEEFRRFGREVMRRTIPRLRAPVVVGVAGARALPIVDDVAAAGAAGVVATALEDLAAVKTACRGRLVVVGNLNGIEMRRWTPDDADEAVRAAIMQGAPGGGFILSDQHGEIPWQVTDEVLLAVAAAVERYGEYPIVA